MAYRRRYKSSFTRYRPRGSFSRSRYSRGGARRSRFSRGGYRPVRRPMRRRFYRAGYMY